MNKEVVYGGGEMGAGGSGLTILKDMSGRVVHECDGGTTSDCLREAIALKRTMTELDLRDIVIENVDFSGVDLSDAYFYGSTIKHCNFTEATLNGVNMTGAVLEDLEFLDAKANALYMLGAEVHDLRNITVGKIRRIDLIGVSLRGLTFRGVPDPDKLVIPFIHKVVYSVIKSGRYKLDMEAWHTCDTTHCRAGLVVALAGRAGAVLEKMTSPSLAATIIYKLSDPELLLVPNWYSSTKDALIDIARAAGEKISEEEVERLGQREY